MSYFRVEYKHSGNEHSPDWMFMFVEADDAKEAIKQAEARGAFGYEFQVYEVKNLPGSGA